MSNQSFENYTKVGQKNAVSNIEVAGRYAFQASAEKAILSDLIQKLSLQSMDRLLDIGCGPGNLLVPLSYWVAQATGIDNETAIARLQARGADAMRVQTLPGNFLTMPRPVTQYNKIYIYSVIQLMDSLDTALAFIDRALSLLEPGGRMLLGDLPNSDKKKRWACSPAGIAASQAWRDQLASVGEHPLADLPVDKALVRVDDDFVWRVMAHARKSGLECYLLPQPSNLPFGNTREDILFVKHA